MENLSRLNCTFFNDTEATNVQFITNPYAYRLLSNRNLIARRSLCVDFIATASPYALISLHLIKGYGQIGYGKVTYPGAIMQVTGEGRINFLDVHPNNGVASIKIPYGMKGYVYTEQGSEIVLLTVSQSN